MPNIKNKIFNSSVLISVLKVCTEWLLANYSLNFGQDVWLKVQTCIVIYRGKVTKKEHKSGFTKFNKGVVVATNGFPHLIYKNIFTLEGSI